MLTGGCSLQHMVYLYAPDRLGSPLNILTLPHGATRVCHDARKPLATRTVAWRICSGMSKEQMLADGVSRIARAVWQFAYAATDLDHIQFQGRSSTCLTAQGHSMDAVDADW